MAEERDANMNAELTKTLRDASLSPSVIADRVIALCNEYVNNVIEQEIQQASAMDRTTTPGLEGFLWMLWDIVIAKIAFKEPESHYRLIDIMRAIQGQGRTGCESWMIWNAEMDWKILPLFGATARELFNGTTAVSPDGTICSAKDTPELAYSILSGDTPSNPSDPRTMAFIDARTCYLNFVRFFMRVTIAEVSDFKHWGIWMMRDGLEVLDLEKPEDLKMNLFYGLTRSLNIEAASVCVQEAGKLLYNSDDVYVRPGAEPGKGGERWPGVHGFHPDRWQLWKAVFREIVDAGEREDVRATAVHAAQAALVSMEMVETDSR